MKLSPKVIGATFGAAMSGLLASSATKAEEITCKDIDLTLVDSVSEAFEACLAGEPVVLLEIGDAKIEAPEIQNRGCAIEEDRDTGRLNNICIVATPADAGVLDGIDYKTRIGNTFAVEDLIEERRVGTIKQEFKFPVSVITPTPAP
jgi:hypothetical protein